MTRVRFPAILLGYRLTVNRWPHKPVTRGRHPVSRLAPLYVSMAEQRTFNPRVQGSSPWRGTARRCTGWPRRPSKPRGRGSTPRRAMLVWTSGEVTCLSSRRSRVQIPVRARSSNVLSIMGRSRSFQGREQGSSPCRTTRGVGELGVPVGLITQRSQVQILPPLPLPPASKRAGGGSLASSLTGKAGDC